MCCARQVVRQKTFPMQRCSYRGVRNFVDQSTLLKPTSEADYAPPPNSKRYLHLCDVSLMTPCTMNAFLPQLSRILYKLPPHLKFSIQKTLKSHRLSMTFSCLFSSFLRQLIKNILGRFSKIFPNLMSTKFELYEDTLT